eukprot:GHVN01068490.1.p3 GENE.GHVN01068490.1~~GHVN01068490.1.p3  ORF type:complete len:261 (-),score=56.19 GHVN01068490.1:3443-4225(-)
MAEINSAEEKLLEYDTCSLDVNDWEYNEISGTGVSEVGKTIIGENDEEDDECGNTDQPVPFGTSLFNTINVEGQQPHQLSRHTFSSFPPSSQPHLNEGGEESFRRRNRSEGTLNEMKTWTSDIDANGAPFVQGGQLENNHFLDDDEIERMAPDLPQVDDEEENSLNEGTSRDEPQSEHEEEPLGSARGSHGVKDHIIYVWKCHNSQVRREFEAWSYRGSHAVYYGDDVFDSVVDWVNAVEQPMYEQPMYGVDAEWKNHWH